MRIFISTVIVFILVIVIGSNIIVKNQHLIDFGEERYGGDSRDELGHAEMDFFNNSTKQTFTNVTVSQIRDGVQYWQRSVAQLPPDSETFINRDETVDNDENDFKNGDILILSADGLNPSYSYIALPDSKYGEKHPYTNEYGVVALHWTKLKRISSTSPEAIKAIGAIIRKALQEPKQLPTPVKID